MTSQPPGAGRADNDDLRARATRSVGWVVLERWSSRLLTLFVLGLLTRSLSPAEFGLVATAVSITAILQVFVDSGLSRSLVQRRELGAKDASTAFWASLSVSLVLCAALCLVAPVLSEAMDQPHLTWVVRALSLSLPLSALSQTPAALLERRLEFKALSMRQFVGNMAGAVAAVPLALLGAGAWALVAQTLVGSTVAVTVLWLATDWRPTFEFSLPALRVLMGTALPILGIDLLDAAQGNLDKLVIGAMFSPETLGYYFIAQRVGIVVTELIVSVLSRVSLTVFSRVQDDRERLNRIFRQMTFIAAAVSVFVFGMIGVFAPHLLHLVFGSQWDKSVPILRVLAPGWALGAIMYFDRTMFIATSNARAGLVLALVQNSVSIGLLFAFAPFGVMGIAFSRLARLAVWPARLYVLRRAVGVDVGRYMLQTARCIVAAVPVLTIMAVLVMSPWADAPAPGWTFLLPCGLLAAASYSTLLWLLAGDENRTVLRSVGQDLRGRLRRAPAASADAD